MRDFQPVAVEAVECNLLLVKIAGMRRAAQGEVSMLGRFAEQVIQGISRLDRLLRGVEVAEHQVGEAVLFDEPSQRAAGCLRKIARGVDAVRGDQVVAADQA